jgi:hypothetical protein
MTVRTFKQLGVAFGSQPANITAKIDNVIVYQGPVTTLNESFPALPNLSYPVTNELFSWTVPDVTFSGNLVMEISIDNNATLLIAELQGNYTVVQSDPPTTPATYVSSGPDGFVVAQWSQFGNTYVNGSLQTVDHANSLDGMWWWRLAPGGTFVENFNVTEGLA